MDEKKSVPDNIISLRDAALEETIPEEPIMSRSRRYNSKASKAKKGFLFYTLGIIVVIVVFGFVGFQLLINYSLLLDKIRGENESTEQEKKDEIGYLSPPSFDVSYSATSSSSLSFTGRAEEDTIVELYINDKLIDTTESDGDFMFRNIKLSGDKNEIKVRSKKGKEKSSFSDRAIVNYREKEPILEVNTPKNGDSFSGGQSILKVTGKSEPYAKVTINGAWAIMDDEGNFNYNYQMQSGENTLQFVSKDDAGQKTEQEVKFNYSP